MALCPIVVPTQNQMGSFLWVPREISPKGTVTQAQCICILSLESESPELASDAAAAEAKAAMLKLRQQVRALWVEGSHRRGPLDFPKPRSQQKGIKRHLGIPTVLEPGWLLGPLLASFRQGEQKGLFIRFESEFKRKPPMFGSPHVKTHIELLLRWLKGAAMFCGHCIEQLVCLVYSWGLTETTHVAHFCVPPWCKASLVTMYKPSRSCAVDTTCSFSEAAPHQGQSTLLLLFKCIVTTRPRLNAQA